MTFPGMTYAKFFPSDWRTGCMILNLEEEGLYIRVCMFMYDTGTAIPDDDQKAARLLNVQVQKYQKVMASLIAKGKIFRAQGLLINERVQEELDKWKLERAARSEAARKREAFRKEQMQRGATPPGVPPHLPPHLPPHQPGGGCLGGAPHIPLDVPPEVSPKKANDYNVGPTTTVAQRYHGSGTNPESRIQKPKKKGEGGAFAPSSADADPSPERSASSQAVEAFGLYNEMAQRVGLPLARTLTPQRRKLLSARLHEHGGLEAWNIALAHVERSAFLQGKNDRGWRCDLDFLLQATRFTKVVEGTYGNGAHAMGAGDGEAAETKSQRIARIAAQAEEVLSRQGGRK